MRLLTPRGELAELGHPEYGSRLNELLGTPNSETRRGLAKLFVLEALAQEPRIEKVLDVTVVPHPDRRTSSATSSTSSSASSRSGAPTSSTIGPFTPEVRVMSFRRRTYPEVLENLLTSLTGGVASESQPFPPPGQSAAPYTLALQQPPAAGRRLGLGLARRAAARVPQGRRLQALGRRALDHPARQGRRVPRPGHAPLRQLRPGRRAPELTDLQVGSVLRTLCETTALELGRIYALLETVYQAGFVDTATGDALDNVVALLGIERVRGGRPAGEVEFTRAQAAPGELTIPAGTRVATADGKTRVRDDRQRLDESRPGLDPRRRARPRAERPAAGGRADAAAGADRGHRVGVESRHRPRSRRRTRPTPSCGHARRTSCTAASARRSARCEQAIARRRHHRRHRRGQRARDDHDHAARRDAPARPAAAAHRVDRARPSGGRRRRDRNAAAAAEGRPRSCG